MIDIEKLVGKVSKEIKYGSTRTVYFPINKRKIILDGIETEIETVLKVANPHRLEITTDKCTLGKFQNKIESELSQTKYSAFILNPDSSYKTNYNGILSPVIQSDPENSWIEMVKVVNPLTVPIFNKFTGGERFPAGLFFKHVQLSLTQHHLNMLKKQNTCKNTSYGQYIDNEKYELIITHPWVKTYISVMEKYDAIPSDFSLRNLGYITHPITEKEIMVICDYGLTKKYHDFLCFVEKNG